MAKAKQPKAKAPGGGPVRQHYHLATTGKLKAPIKGKKS